MYLIILKLQVIIFLVKNFVGSSALDVENFKREFRLSKKIFLVLHPGCSIFIVVVGKGYRFFSV